MSVFTKDKTKYASTGFFVERNGVKPIVKVGRNFDNDTLYYMAKPGLARDIANKVEMFTSKKPYFMVEICAGIGGNTFEFLARKECASVMSFERDPKRALYLQRNIMAYGLDDKSIVIANEITGEEDFTPFQDSIFYFDPPWLPADYKSSDTGNYKDFYIRKNMKVGNLTLEQWLEKLSETAYMVMFRVGPSDFELGEVPGWTYLIDNLGRDEIMRAQAEDGKLYRCFNNRKIKGASIDKFGGYVKAIPTFKLKLEPHNTKLADKYIRLREECSNMSFEDAKNNQSCYFTRYKFTDPEPEEEKSIKLETVKVKETQLKADSPKPEMDDTIVIPFSEQVPKIANVPLPTKGIDTDSPEWIAEFQAYLSFILSKFITDKEGNPLKDLINQLLSGVNMPIWIKAFTDKMVYPDSSQNYEMLETIGDSILKYVFTLELPEMLKKSDIPVTNNSITQVRLQYTSGTGTTDFMIEFGKSMKFKNWMRTSLIDTPEDKVNEDLTESFIGALHETGDNIPNSPAMGIRLCRRFGKFYTRYIKLNKQIAIGGNYLMAVGQNIDSLTGMQNSLEESMIGAAGSYEYYVSIKAEAFERLKKNVPELGIQSQIIGLGRGAKKETARNDAYINAWNYFQSIGLTSEFVKEKKSGKVWKKIENIDKMAYNIFYGKNRRMGLIPLDKFFGFEEKELQNKKTLVTLYKILDNKKEALTEGIGADSTLAQIEAIKSYNSKY